MKLTGWEWWRSLGSPRRVVAPMVEYSELSFRALCRAYGAQLAYSPMLHAKSAAAAGSAGASYLARSLSTCAGDRPLIVQFCGNDPCAVLAAARRVERLCDGVDLNLGCPQAIARRGGYGAFLLEDTDACVAIVRALADGLAVPVTVKMRLLAEPGATLRTVLALQAAGASAVALHGRRRDEIKERTGAADWAAIAAVRAHPDVRVPIIANGGVACAADADACLAATGAAAVMVSEALLEYPGLFSDGWRAEDAPPLPLLRAPAPPRRRADALDLATEYLQLAALFDEPQSAVRGHLMKMLFAPLKIDTAARMDVLRARTVGEAAAVVRRLAAAYGHPAAAAPEPEAAAASDAALRAWAATRRWPAAGTARPPPRGAGRVAVAPSRRP